MPVSRPPRADAKRPAEPSVRSRVLGTHAALLGLAVFVTALLCWAVPRSVQPGDAGEFATVMLRGGVPHPSGYPWMRALGAVARAFEALGIGSATAAALPCALAGAAAPLVLHPLLSRLAGTAAATFVLALLAASSTIVVHAMDSEVWGPLLLLAAVVLRLAMPPGRVSPWWLGLALGLAVSHHLTAVLLVPLAIGAAWPTPAAGSDPRVGAASVARAGSIGLAGSAVGLLALLTLMVGTEGAWRWGDTRSLSGLLHHVSRADYGVLQLSLHQESVSAFSQWGRSLAAIAEATTAGLTSAPVVGAAVVLLAIIALVRFAPASLRRSVRWGLAGSVVASTLAFPALHNIDPSNPFGAWILSRFDQLSLLLLALPLAVAVRPVWTWASTPPRRVGVVVLMAAALSLQLSHSARRGVPAGDDTVERYAVDLLRTPAPDTKAVVFGTDDHRTFGVLFAQAVLGEGANVLYVDASLLAHGWYRAWLRQRWPELPDVDKPLRLMGAIWQHPTLSETPIYLANDFSKPSTTLDRIPEGLLWRVIPPPALMRTPPPPVEQVVQRHRAAFARYRPGRGPPTIRAAHPFTADLAAHYNEPTQRLVEVLAATGHAEQARALASALLPP